MTHPATPQLTRPVQGRVIAGVCAGVAKHYGWGVLPVRILAVLSCLLPGPQIIAYLVAWAVIKDDNNPQQYS